MSEKENRPTSNGGASMENRKQITLRVPKALHEELKATAKRKGISMNEEIISRLDRKTTE